MGEIYKEPIRWQPELVDKERAVDLEYIQGAMNCLREALDPETGLSVSVRKLKILQLSAFLRAEFMRGKIPKTDMEAVNRLLEESEIEKLKFK